MRFSYHTISPAGLQESGKRSKQKNVLRIKKALCSAKDAFDLEIAVF